MVEHKLRIYFNLLMTLFWVPAQSEKALISTAIKSQRGLSCSSWDWWNSVCVGSWTHHVLYAFKVIGNAATLLQSRPSQASRISSEPCSWHKAFKLRYTVFFSGENMRAVYNLLFPFSVANRNISILSCLFNKLHFLTLCQSISLFLTLPNPSAVTPSFPSSPCLL